MSQVQSLSDDTPTLDLPLSDLVHIGVGWRAALADLAGPGRRWLVSPWVNSGDTDLTELLDLIRPKDRLILRARPEDFIRKMSSFNAVQRFLERQVDVRYCRHLHAKVYAHEHPEGQVWLGSANLTRRGSHGDTQGHGNFEAMSGPHRLTPQALAQLEALWKVSLPFDRAAVEMEIAEMQRDERTYATLLGEDALGTLTLQVDFKLLQGQLTLPALWLGMHDLKGVSFPAVRFVVATTEVARRLRRLKRQTQKTMQALAVPVAGSPGLYVLRVSDHAKVQAGLVTLQRQAQAELGALLEQQVSDLREDFLRRFEEAFRNFISGRYRDARPLVDVMREASLAFDSYVRRDPFGMSVQFGVPLPNLSDPYDPLTQSVLSVRGQARPLLHQTSSRQHASSMVTSEDLPY